jgi:hypothetical protein
VNYKKQKFIFTVFEIGKFKIKRMEDLRYLMRTLLPVTAHGGRVKDVSEIAFVRTPVPSKKYLPSNFNQSQRPHFLK